MQACPLNYISMDKNITKVVGFLVFLTILSALALQSIALFALLAYDFSVRIAQKNQLSPLYQIASYLQKFMPQKSAKVDFAAKKIAYSFALVFSLLLIATLVFNQIMLFHVIGIVFAVCVFFELFFNFCVGCKVYYLYMSLFR